MKQKIVEKRGITLIALVITIIVLLILAGVTIVTLTGENGILTKAGNAKISSLQATEKEKIILAYQAVKADKLANQDTTEITAEELRNQFITDNGEEEITISKEGNIFTIIMKNGTYKLDDEGIIEIIGEGIDDDNGTSKTASKITKSDYGKSVNYTVSVTNNSTNNKEEISGWRIFYADDTNIYLTTESYVKCSLLAKTTNNGMKTEHQVTWSTGDANNPTAKFDNVLQDYIGSESITTNNPARKWISLYFSKSYSSTNNNMKAVAYMLDIHAWSEYADNDYAEYAIGGPTLELFVASYNKTHDEQLEIEASSNIGYRLKRSSDSEMQNYLKNFTIGDTLYIPTYENGSKTMWLASPSNNSAEEIMVVYSGCDDESNGGYISNNEITNNENGFKPIVCLKSSTKLKLSSDGNSYEIVK